MIEERSIQGFLSGYISVVGTVGMIFGAMVAPVPARIRYAIAAAVGGGTTTTLDLLLNDFSVWTRAADKPTLSGTAGGRFLSGPINRSAIRPGDVLKMVVLQAGNKTDLVMTVALEEL